MREELEQLKQQVADLSRTVTTLEEKLTYGKSDYEFAELVRNIVFTDTDNSSAITTSIIIPSGGATISVPRNPDLYFRIMIRNTPYKLGLYKLSTV